MLFLSQALSFLGSCLSQHLLLASASSQHPAPHLSPALSAWTPLTAPTNQQEATLSWDPGAAPGSSLAPTPRDQAEGTTPACLEGLLSLSAPTHFQGRKIALWS